jgi:uncharacterized integral membrane protein
MKLSWILVLLLLLVVTIFSVQNATPITVKFLSWELNMSAALVIQLAAVLGGLVGLVVGSLSRRRKRADPLPATPPDEQIAGEPPTFSR